MAELLVSYSNREEYVGSSVHAVHTALTDGSNSAEEMATPTSDSALPASIASATTAPDGSANKTPTHIWCTRPLYTRHKHQQRTDSHLQPRPYTETRSTTLVV